MSTAFLTNGALSSSHWVIVIGIGLAFFVVQIALTIGFYFHMRQQQHILKRLWRDFERGGDGRDDGNSRLQAFPWLSWVHANFPVAATTPPGNFSREEVLQAVADYQAGRLGSIPAVHSAPTHLVETTTQPSDR